MLQRRRRRLTEWIEETGKKKSKTSLFSTRDEQSLPQFSTFHENFTPTTPQLRHLLPLPLRHHFSPHHLSPLQPHLLRHFNSDHAFFCLAKKKKRDFLCQKRLQKIDNIKKVVVVLFWQQTKRDKETLDDREDDISCRRLIFLDIRHFFFKGELLILINIVFLSFLSFAFGSLDFLSFLILFSSFWNVILSLYHCQSILVNLSQYMFFAISVDVPFFTCFPSLSGNECAKIY